MYDWKAIQKELKRLGFDPGEIDGYRGPKTEAALINFQKSVGLLTKTFTGRSTYFGPKSYAALMSKVPAAPTEPPWLAEARKMLNLHEDRNERALRDWFHEAFSWLDPGDVSWCGAFVATCLKKWNENVQLPDNPLTARSWTKFGDSCKPQLGSVLVFWRGLRTGWQGHVGFYVGEDVSSYHVLGGNQSNAVTIARLSKTRFLDSRWPTGYPLSGVTQQLAGGGKLSQNEA